jgi:CelD/BcsL family acetyltransferase involved in cellulose biosynthesis
MSPADLLRAGPVTDIVLHLDSYAGVSPGFSFRGIVCRDGVRPPTLAEIPALPPGIDVLEYSACALETKLPTVSFGWHVFRYEHAWTTLVVEFQGSFEEYWSRFRSKARWSIKRKAEKLQQTYGQIEYRQYGSSEELAEFHCATEQVKLGEYQQRALHNSIPQVASFHRDMLRLASLNQSRGYLMMINGQPIAYLYCSARGTELVHQLSGYDSDFAQFSPGLLLQRYALEQLFAERTFSSFDFFSGGGQHKSFFATACKKRADVYFFRKTPRALALELDARSRIRS